MATEPLVPGEPSRLGDYWLAGRLGAGGQGVVYEGYGPDGVRVAVKALHGDYSPTHREMFLREVDALRRVSQFCTARVLAVDVESTPPFLVSEYVAGPTLQQAVETSGAHGADELYRLAIGIATALTAIHRAGVVHRDLKPANVLLGPDGPRVIDFGIARTDDTSRSATGMKGTPRYMAPEVFQGQRPGPAVDIWAWGATMLFAASGKAPFDGETMPQVMHAALNTQPDTTMLPARLEPIVTAALAKDPARRPTAQQLLLDLLGGAPDADLLQQGEQAAAAVRPPVAAAPTLGERAEDVFRRLDPAAQAAVPTVLLRMVAAGDELLRPATRGEFTDGQSPEPAIEAVLVAFSQAGLLTWNGQDFAIATPALLRAWPRLRAWWDAERGGLAMHQELTAGVRLWDAHGRKKNDLFQGTRLDRALTWAATGRHRLTVNAAERAFLDAGTAAARRRSTLRTGVSIVLAALLIVSLGTGSVVVQQSRTVAEQRDLAARQRDSAIGRQLAGQAVQVRRTNPVLGRRLAIAAAALAGDTPDTHHALLTLSSQWEQDIWQVPGVDVSWNSSTPTGAGPQIFWKGNTIVLVDPDSRRLGRTIKVPGAALSGMESTLDGKQMLTLQKDQTMMLWDLATGTPRPLPHKHVARAGLWFSPTGQKLITTRDGMVRVLETATGRELFRVKAKYDVYGPVMSPDERSLVMPLNDGEKKMRLAWWDLTTGKEVQAPGHFKGYRSYLGTTFSPDGRFLATRHEGQITIVNARTREIRGSLAVPEDSGSGGDLTFSRDGAFLAYDMTLWSTEPEFGASPYLAYRTDAMCNDTRFSAGGTSLRCFDSQKRFRSIDVTAFVRQRRVSGSRINDSTISLDGTTVAAGDANSDVVQIWDTASGARRGAITLAGGADRTMVLSPDGRLLGVAREDGTVEIWDVRSRARRVLLNVGRAPSTRPAPSFSPDGKAVAVLTPGTSGDGAPGTPGAGTPHVLKFWDTATGRPLGQAAAMSPITVVGDSDGRIVWSRDGRRVVASAALGVVEFPSGRTLVRPGPLTASVSLSVQALSAKNVLATVDERSLVLRNTENLGQIGNPILLPQGSIKIAAFSPDGRLAATADPRGRIDIWDVENQRRIGLPLTGHTVGVSTTTIESLAFSPDGTRVHSVGGDDGVLVTHLIAPELLKADLCAKAGPLTEQEWATYVKDTGYQKTC
ncbi:WD40 repeat domain-containing serine/threonine-protein kinase [Thermomonospora umbrina]|uniref:Serine/threonine protein kinase n=1 Tax=Thermomonospora umbrina TaxID=111806 RepID=A0A3D9SPA2_9ACTN|nr:WD40 repeat domain-containing serine/threonine-protein kinase [Thermomonospora umbrina]REE97769.1 serine/threonine protein kinase [Thermomonospora umbrina]